MTILAGSGPSLSFELLAIFPCDTRLIWVHGLLFALTAPNADQFLQQERQTVEPIGVLYFAENNGFVLGIVIGVRGFVFYGRIWLYATPLRGLAVALTLNRGRMLLVSPASSGKTRKDRRIRYDSARQRIIERHESP